VLGPNPPAVPCMAALDKCNRSYVAAGQYETDDLVIITRPWGVTCDTAGTKACGATASGWSVHEFPVPESYSFNGVAPDTAVTCSGKVCPSENLCPGVTPLPA